MSSPTFILCLLCFALTVSGFPFPDPEPGPRIGDPSERDNSRSNQPGFHQGGGRVPYPASGPPEFLREASENAREEYFQLLEDSDEKMKGKLKSELTKWAERNGVKKEYEEFMKHHEEKRRDFHDLVAANLAGEASEAFNRIWDVTENDKFSRNAECQKMNEVLGELRMVVRHLVPLLSSQILGPPPAGCFQSQTRHHQQQFGQKHMSNNNNKGKKKGNNDFSNSEENKNE